MRGSHVLAGVVVACALVVAAHAQQASFLPPAASGSGVTVGEAISGGTASRLLFSDGSTQVSTATPVAVTSSLDLTSGTLDVGGACTLDSTLSVAGQATFTRDPASTASADATVRINPATSAANERLFVVQDNGTDEFWVDKEGDAQLTGALRVDSTSDLRGAISNGGSGTCFTGVTGVPCFADNVGVATGTDSSISLQAGTTASVSGLAFYNSAGSVVGVSRYYGSAFAASAALQNKVTLLGVGTSNTVVAGITASVSAGTSVFEVRDSTTNPADTLLASVDGAGRMSPLLYGSQTNCSDGAGAAACTAAPAGSVVIDAAATTVTVSTTAVTANSQIFLQEDSSLGAKLSVTCNTTTGRTYTVTSRTAATSFVVTASAAPVTNPACLSYFIVN